MPTTDRSKDLLAGYLTKPARSQKRQVVGIFADQHMGDGGLGRQAAHDQMAGCWGLGHPVGAGPAGILRPHGHDDAQLGRDDVQPLAAVFADLVHDTAATGTDQAGGLDDLFDPRQRGRQIANGALRRGFGRAIARLGGTDFLLRLDLGQSDGQILKRQLPFIF